MYFLDSSVCIDFLRGRLPQGYRLMQESDPRLFKVPAIVEAELFLGALKSAAPGKNRLLVERFLSPFEIIPFTSECARIYAQIRSSLEQKSATIGPNDYLIAASALAHGAVVVTSNMDEFLRVPNLSVETWAEVGFDTGKHL